MFAAAKAESDRYDTEQLAEEKIRVFSAAAAAALLLAAKKKKKEEEEEEKKDGAGPLPALENDWLNKQEFGWLNASNGMAPLKLLDCFPRMLNEMTRLFGKNMAFFPEYTPLEGPTTGTGCRMKRKELFDTVRCSQYHDQARYLCISGLTN